MLLIKWNILDAPIPDGEVLIDDTPPPRRPARRQARAPDPHSRREQPLRWDPLSRERGLFLKQTLPRTPTDVWSLLEPLEPDSHGTAGRRGGHEGGVAECPHPRSVSTRRDRRSVPHRFPPDLAGLESRGGPWPPV